MVFFTGPAMWDAVCAYCKAKIYRGEICVKEGFLKARYYHNECWRKHREEEKR
jgi:hypothetical protein